MSVGKASLVVIMPYAKDRIDDWVEALNTAMDRYEINTPLRQAAFLAQVAHESEELRFVKELWGPTPAQQGYEGRADLGNTEPGDGFKFRGRGLLEITGRSMYALYAAARGIACVDHPELLELQAYAADSAGWVWRDVKHLNDDADRGDFKTITKRINGGFNGWTQRKAYYEKAKAVL